MSKNISDRSVANGLTNAINDLKKVVKQNRTNQLYPMGFFVLPGLTSDPPTGTTPEGSTYFNTATHHLRILISGTWQTIL